MLHLLAVPPPPYPPFPPGTNKECCGCPDSQQKTIIDHVFFVFFFVLYSCIMIVIVTYLYKLLRLNPRKKKKQADVIINVRMSHRLFSKTKKKKKQKGSAEAMPQICTQCPMPGERGLSLKVRCRESLNA